MLQFLSHIHDFKPQETNSLNQMETEMKNKKSMLDELMRREQVVQKVNSHSQQYLKLSRAMS